MILTKSAALTLHTLILRFLHSMTFNLAWTYAHFLSMLCFKCTMCFKYTLDIFSEFNGYRVVRR